MAKDKPIFGLRFDSNEKLLPSQEELRIFLQSAKKAGAGEPRANGLAAYRTLLEDLQAFERRQLQGGAQQDFREKMFYGVLGQSYFVNPALKSAVEEYQYHLDALLSLDFRKPAAFIRAAEEETGRLNPKKKEDAVKLARLTGMAEERRRAIEALGKRRAALAAELGDIARYIRDNLVKIEKLSESSIVVLVDTQLRRTKENQLIEDVKTYFKDRLRDSLHRGPVTKQDLEAAKKDVASLSKEIATLIREDVYAITGLFEAVHDHAKRIAREIDTLLGRIAGAKDAGFEDEAEPFAQVEKVLLSLVSEYHFELKTTEVRTETAHEDIFLEKRREMLDYLFDLLEKERRTGDRRRPGEDRRKFNDPARKGPERRSGKDRRSGKNRRAGSSAPGGRP
jgi:uncharacterized protein YeeX (DUF496 family)